MTNTKPTILHVDDDADIREIVKISLEVVGGMKVIQCSSGAEALEKVDAAEPDLFLLDVMMPEMTGVQALTELRKRPGHSDTPAIFLTAKANGPEIDELINAGATTVIQKPFDPMTMSEKLTAAYAEAS